MDKQLNFELKKLSLEEMALRRVVINFWSEMDILSLIEAFPFKEHSGPHLLSLWKERVGGRVKSKISNSLYPESLKKMMNLIVTPVGLEIVKWKLFIDNYVNDSEDTLTVLKQLCWTSAGTIDYGKSVEKLVRLQTIDVEDRFGLACAFCLADSLPAIWETLPEEYKEYFRDDLLKIADEEGKITFYWAYFLKGESTKLLEMVPDFHQKALKFSLMRGIKEAAEYFLQKLSNEFRDSVTFMSYIESSLSRHFDPHWMREKQTEVAFYFLSLIPSERQIQIMKHHSVVLFREFLRWPREGLLSENADILWKFLSEANRFKNVLVEIRAQILNSGYYSPEMMQEFFLRCPRDFRKVLEKQTVAWVILMNTFLTTNDTETLRVIFRCVDYVDRLRLVSSYIIFRQLDNLLKKDEQQFVEFIFLEMLDSKEKRDQVKLTYMRFIGGLPKEFFRKRRWQHFFKSIDETDTSAPKKRESDDETPTSAKKLRPEEEKSVLQRS
ncbi:unnamed protein product [Larinioides sclopetarius]|uniref:Uncharacterized protein n=1 Tax=Larinioides sclopetarius TaxID=280406 RepID=A0AAV2BT55_9ARAC